MAVLIFGCRKLMILGILLWLPLAYSTEIVSASSTRFVFKVMIRQLLCIYVILWIYEIIALSRPDYLLHNHCIEYHTLSSFLKLALGRSLANSQTRSGNGAESNMFIDLLAVLTYSLKPKGYPFCTGTSNVGLKKSTNDAFACKSQFFTFLKIEEERSILPGSFRSGCLAIMLR